MRLTDFRFNFDYCAIYCVISIDIPAFLSCNILETIYIYHNQKGRKNCWKLHGKLSLKLKILPTSTAIVQAFLRVAFWKMIFLAIDSFNLKFNSLQLKIWWINFFCWSWAFTLFEIFSLKLKASSGTTVKTRTPLIGRFT